MDTPSNQEIMLEISTSVKTTDGIEELGTLSSGSIIDAVVEVGGGLFLTREEVTSVRLENSSDVVHVETASGNKLKADSRLKFLSHDGWSIGSYLRKSQYLAGIDSDGAIINDRITSVHFTKSVINLAMPETLTAVVVYAGGTGIVVKS